MSRSPLLRYGVAALAVALVLLLRLLLSPLITQETPFLLLSAAVMIGAWFGGLGPGLLATALATLATDYFFLPPRGSFTAPGIQVVPLGLFALQGVLISSLVAALRAARQRAQEGTLEAQKHEENLRQSEERFRLLVQGVEDYAIFMLDPEGRVASWNEGAERINGYAAQEIIGEHFSVFYPHEAAERGHPKEELRIATEEGRYEEEGVRVRKDGSRFRASVLITALRDGEGNLRGFSKVVRDITERKEAEDRLQESEERFRATFEQAAVGVAHVGPDGKWLRVNDKLCEITGYPCEELLGMTFQDITHPEDLQKDLDHLNRLLAGEIRTYSTEKRYVRKDKSVVWVNLTVSAVSDTSGHLKYFITVVEDITERKKAEKALSQSEERYRAVVKQSTEGLYLVDGGTKRILETNPALQNMLGYTAEELRGMELHKIVAHPRADVEGNIERTLREGWRFIRERRYLRKDGSVVDVEVAASAIYYGGKQVICAAIRDITERKRAEKALRENEELYRTVVEQAAENIFLVDVDTRRILEANAALHRSLGYSTEALRRLTLHDIVAHDYENIERNIHLILEEGRHFIGERQYRRKDGTLIDVEVGASAISYGGREVMCVVAHDITERKRSEEALRRSLDALLALYETGQLLSSSLEREEIGSRLLEIMGRISGTTAAVINLRDDRGRLSAWRTFGPEALLASVRDEPEARAARRAASEAEEERVFEVERPDLEGERLAGIFLPLRVRDRVIGVLEVYSPEHLAESGAVETFASLANQAASALENARLYEELAERGRQLHDLVRRLLTTQEEERRRVAYDVHDGLAQTAAAAYQHLQIFARGYPPGSARAREELNEALELLRRTVGEARHIIADLRPTVLDDFGLAAAVRLQVEKLRTEGWEVGYEEALGDERLPSEVETTLFRVAQEALTNARKHARATRAHVTLRRLGGTVRLLVRDEGSGFRPDEVTNGGGPGERVGLSGMRERISLLGGRFEIHSEPGTGTSVLAEVQLPATEEDGEHE